jgi:serine protease inhibitor
MIGIRRYVVAGVAAAALAACGSPSEPNNKQPDAITALPRSLSGGEQALVAANNTFAVGLLSAVNATRLEENVFISPLSASIALGMTMNGAVGRTLEEMRTTLGYGTLSRDEINAKYKALIALLRGLDPKVDFRIANSIWTRQEFAPFVDPAFVQEQKDYFDASVSALDFAAASAPATINAWAKTNTNGKIEKVIDSIDDSLVMLLMNAIYFKGDWRHGFDKAKTKNEAFRTLRGTSVQVPMMRQVGKMRYATQGERTAVELAYGGDAFAMTIILPGPNESVNDLTGALTPALWQSIDAASSEREVELTMPRFRLEWEGMLKAPLQSMGMRQPFVEGQADFSRLSPSRGPDLFISYVKQNTFVDVNEVGTEAAAVTQVGIGIVSMPVRPIVRVDRPFLFVIRERLTGTLLFVGKIVEPKS